ncbi:NADH-quinone oxidoreductase subunit L [Paroceanicella profunda]|uniref:NADH-quinone oxidoreductase subunit L n=1 Tax=Paroceanicella profunda TaxID=2579971 RepID=A0A5B8FZ91_9RHOB|nr:NADH-quinone oxidoreductase subunit L [Paroceanicella profunda]QDL92994.1 NADH-quinone oxidoreductase subunit L [Paroceanicella profunda]
MVDIILFAPLLGAIVAGFGWRITGEKVSMHLTTGLLFLCAILSWVVFFTTPEHTESHVIFRWIETGTLTADWAVRIDRLTTVMLVVVTTVSALVHLYSVGYMDKDPQWKEGEVYKPRFFAYLSLFTFAMLMLVTADNLAQMFFGWEGVGVASYLLIGFYYRKPSAGAAAMKAFIINRVGDFGFLLGILALYFVTDSIQFDEIFDQVPEMATQTMTFLSWQVSTVEIIGFLLFIGAMGKSAQLLLHTWLPDAMEGPTPVSALIHAATMVTAGVFLVCRMSPLYEYAPVATGFITVLGGLTAFFAATVGLVQNDIKRVIAYSTCSQLGYMFAAAGVGVYQAAMFHLFTHAFFKALLFLCAGSVIHAMHHEQDLRAYGGLRKKIPVTFWCMMIGTLAITGVGLPLVSLGVPIGFAGFVSKDAIIESTLAAGTATGDFAFVLLVVAALFTSFYSWRLVFMTFYGAPRGDHHTHEHAHESPKVMLLPLLVLAVGAVAAGMIWYGGFIGHHWEEFWGEAIFQGAENEVLHHSHDVPVWAKLAPFLAMLIGLVTAWAFYIRSPDLPGRLAKAHPGIHQFLLNKWYFDELYDLIFIQPARWLGRFLWKAGDRSTIDGGINGVAMIFLPMLSRIAGRAQSGYVFHYAFAMIIGLILIITWFAVSGGAH